MRFRTIFLARRHTWGGPAILLSLALGVCGCGRIGSDATSSRQLELVRDLSARDKSRAAEAAHLLATEPRLSVEAISALCRILPDDPDRANCGALRVLQVHCASVLDVTTRQLIELPAAELSDPAHVLRCLGPNAKPALPQLVLAENRAIELGLTGVVQAIQIAFLAIGPPSESQLSDLTPMLMSPSWRVRRKTVDLLGSIQPRDSLPIDTCHSVADLLVSDCSLAVQINACDFLAQHCVGDEDAAGPIEKALLVALDSHQDPLLMQLAARALSRRDHVSRRALSHLHSATVHWDQRVRSAALTALSKHGVDLTTVHVQMLVADEREARGDGLARLAEEGVATAWIRSAVDECLRDPDPGVRLQAAETAAHLFGLGEEEIGVLRQGLASDHMEYRFHALVVVTRLGPACTPLRDLVQRLEDDPDDAVRAQADRALSSMR